MAQNFLFRGRNALLKWGIRVGYLSAITRHADLKVLCWKLFLFSRLKCSWLPTSICACSGEALPCGQSLPKLCALAEGALGPQKHEPLPFLLEHVASKDQSYCLMPPTEMLP